MAGEDELPPVVAPFLADISDLVRGIEEAKADVKSFTGEEASATLDVNNAPALAKIAETEAALKALDAQSIAQALRLNVLPRPVLNSLAAQQGIGGAEAMGAKSDVIAAMLGAGAAEGGGGGGGLFTGLGAGLGFGGGAGRGILGGLAGIGTLGGLAGFSAEGVLGSALGIGGSIAGAGIGAGFLGLGALGTGAVGMGTDAAGIGQAINDVRKYRTALNALNTALLTFGKNSIQAAQAQAHLKAVLGTMPTAAQSAIVTLSQAMTQMKALWDRLTGPAEAKGAGILTQGIGVVEKFIPTIGKFATQNMSIIRHSLQSFFTWLSTAGHAGGLGIFTSLEKVFQKDLPIGMHALEQGFELLAKTITIASTYGGHFLRWINDFLSRMNGATFKKWSHFVNDMIGLFNAWFPLLMQVGKTLMVLFKPAVGLGKQLAEFLTSLLKTLDAFLGRAGNQSVLHRLFTAHAGELIKGFGAVLKALLPVLEQFLLAFVKIETVFRGGFMVVLEAFAKALTAITHIPFGAQLLGWSMAIGLVMRGLWLLGAWFLAAPGRIMATVGSISKMVGQWGSLISKIGTVLTSVGSFIAQYVAQLARGVAAGVAWLAEHTVMAASFIAENIAMAASATAAFIAENAATLGLVVAIAAVVAGIVWLATHWHQAWTDIKNWALDAWHFIDHIFRDGIIGDILSVAFPLVGLLTHWSTVWHTIQDIAMAVWRGLHSFVFAPLETVFSMVVTALRFFGSVWTTIWHGIQSVLSAVWGVIGPIISAISTGIHDIAGALGGGGITAGAQRMLAHHFAQIHMAHLAEGGIVSRPTLAIVGEAGPEMVVPLSQLHGVSLTGANIAPLAGGAGVGQHIEVNILGSVEQPYQFANEIAWHVGRLSPVGVR